jgi:hypothetical protein
MSATTPEPEYAYWNVPATSFTITYSLNLFHEIDFQVNEGYRRIPHGGIEIGGLLFGQVEGNDIRIEAFRPIDCEHALGPSFVLSERDLAALRVQLAATKSDPELAEVEAVGWLISHTRSPLRMNDREAALFDELFPDSWRITVLAKPERFQPTRFGFLVRNADGSVPRDATDQAIILPLSGRAARSADGPVASIAAPEQKPVPSRPPAPTQAIPEPVSPVSELPTESAEPLPPPLRFPEPTRQAPLVPAQTMAHAEKREVERVAMPFSPIPPATPFSPSLNQEPFPPPPKQEPFPAVETPAPSIDEIRRKRSDNLQIADIRLPPEPSVDRIQEGPQRSNWRLAIILLSAAALGCTAGYWAYLQLPSATIPLEMQTQRSAVLLSWPPDQTRDVVYAAIRIDDGQQTPLTEEQKTAGQATIPANSDNVKIELIARHWMRESRGIIRYVKARAATQIQPASSR